MVAHQLPPFEIRDVPDPHGGLILELRANGLRFATARATADMITSMGIGREAVRAELERSLNDLRLAPELDRQVFGYWFGPGDEIPTSPIGSPTGAVLPRMNTTIGSSDLLCLDLVPVQNYWLVLSELGRYTYQHTSGMLNGEEWRFVPVKEAAGRWPVVFRVTFADAIHPDHVQDHYGFEASTRVRLGAPVVQLHLLRQP